MQRRSVPKGNKGFLTLERREEESIMIGDNIEVYVSSIRGDRVKIAIRAPRDIPVHRKEVYDAHKSRQRDDGETRGYEGDRK